VQLCYHVNAGRVQLGREPCAQAAEVGVLGAAQAHA